MLLNTTLNSETARQFRGTIFKILRVFCILSQSVHNIQLIECYLVPDHQEVVKYMKPYIVMLISTTARQPTNCMQIILYHVASFWTNHFQNTPCPAVSCFLDFEKIQIEKTELSGAVFQIIGLLYCFALFQLLYNL